MAQEDRIQAGADAFRDFDEELRSLPPDVPSHNGGQIQGKNVTGKHHANAAGLGEDWCELKGLGKPSSSPRNPEQSDLWGDAKGASSQPQKHGFAERLDVLAASLGDHFCPCHARGELRQSQAQGSCAQVNAGGGLLQEVTDFAQTPPVHLPRTCGVGLENPGRRQPQQEPLQEAEHALREQVKACDLGRPKKQRRTPTPHPPPK